LAGKDCANPIGAILSVAMLLSDAFGLSIEAELVHAALGRVLARGYRTSDIAERDSRTVGTAFFTEVLREEMQASVEHAERYGWGV
jgi:3-isopropylmalate dehydrogenase